MAKIPSNQEEEAEVEVAEEVVEAEVGVKEVEAEEEEEEEDSLETLTIKVTRDTNSSRTMTSPDTKVLSSTEDNSIESQDLGGKDMILARRKDMEDGEMLRKTLTRLSTLMLPTLLPLLKGMWKKLQRRRPSITVRSRRKLRKRSTTLPTLSYSPKRKGRASLRLRKPEPQLRSNQLALFRKASRRRPRSRLCILRSLMQMPMLLLHIAMPLGSTQELVPRRRKKKCLMIEDHSEEEEVEEAEEKEEVEEAEAVIEAAEEEETEAEEEVIEAEEREVAEVEKEEAEEAEEARR